MPTYTAATTVTFDTDVWCYYISYGGKTPADHIKIDGLNVIVYDTSNGLTIGYFCGLVQKGSTFYCSARDNNTQQLHVYKYY